LLLLLLLCLICGGLSYSIWFKKDKPGGVGATTPAATTPAVTTAPPTTAPPTTEPPTTPPPTTPPPATVAMPNVVGLGANDADAKLHDLGITNVTYVNAQRGGKPVQLLSSWTVTKQSVAPGTQIPVDTPIVLTCKENDAGKG